MFLRKILSFILAIFLLFSHHANAGPLSWLLKKGMKESAEEAGGYAVRKGVKEGAEEASEFAIKKGMKESVEEAGEYTVKKGSKTLTREGAEAASRYAIRKGVHEVGGRLSRRVLYREQLAGLSNLTRAEIDAAEGILKKTNLISSAKIIDPKYPIKIKKIDSFVSSPIDRRIINRQYAGQVYPIEKLGSVASKYPKSVRFSKEGYPDFRPYAKKEVTIDNLNGGAGDFYKANKEAGYDRTPEGYTWHHHEDGKTMLLVPTDLHSQVRHSGGASILRSNEYEN